MRKIKFSIISVCYNCENSISETMDSLIRQTYTNYECIIIDGKSEDETLKKIEKYRPSIPNITIVSEKDKGIYDAMNKGIKMATGDFIYFLNFGDKFYNEKVLEEVAKKINDLETIYYGNYIKENEKETSPDKLNDWYFLSERMICHQTIFAPLSSFENNMFDLSFKYCADRKWLIACIKRKKMRYEHLNLVVSIYDANGFSSNSKFVTKESKIVLKNFYPAIIIKLLFVKNFVGSIIRKLR